MIWEAAYNVGKLALVVGGSAAVLVGVLLFMASRNG